MSALHAGLLCTSMFLSACACLYSWMSAISHRMRRAQAGSLLLLGANFAFLSVRLANLESSAESSPLVWSVIAGLLMVLSAAMLLRQLRRTRRHISQVSIKESCDRLPVALCFALKNGQPLLRNLKMDALSHQITGEALNNANSFWAALEKQPVVTLTDGQTWSFERTAIEVDGQAVYQIIGTNITEEARLNRQLEAENQRLDDVNCRLRQYGLNAQTVAREKESMRIKIRLHDQLGYTVLRTRQFLSTGQDDLNGICAAWRQCIHSLRDESAAEPVAGSYEELTAAARMIGVTIDMQGAFPEEGTRLACLVGAAMHESLTNLVRHAGGTRLEVLGAREAGTWRILFQNDGRLPAGAIVEGGGLSSLRSQVETAGGAMAVAHSPRFLLTLILPEETEEISP